MSDCIFLRYIFFVGVPDKSAIILFMLVMHTYLVRKKLRLLLAGFNLLLFTGRKQDTVVHVKVSSFCSGVIAKPVLLLSA